MRLPQRPYNCLEHLEYLAHQLECLGDIAVRDSAGSLTYQELYYLSRRFGSALIGSNITPSEHVFVCLKDSSDFIIVFLGCMYAGIVPVLINPGFSKSEVNEVVKKSPANNVICSADRADYFNQRSWNLILTTAAVSIKNYALSYRYSDVPVTTTALSDAFILCTSGTTGHTKLVVHSQQSIVGTGLQYGSKVLDITKDDVIFSAAKLSHAYGLGNSLSIPFTHGASVVLESELPTAERIVKHIEQNKITMFAGVPRHYASLLGYNKTADLSSLRICLSAGEAVPTKISTDFKAKYQIDIIDAIGSTELLGFALSSNQLVPGCEIKLINDGEFYVKSPLASTKYYNDPESTAYTFVDGWIRTNDVYHRDAAGNLQYQGRTNDCIKVNSVYVSLTMLEQKLYNVESVTEAAVVTYPNKYGLDRIKVCVVLKPGFDSKEEYQNILRTIKNSEQVKIPFIIKFVDSLPRTSSGKIRKYIL